MALNLHTQTVACNVPCYFHCQGFVFISVSYLVCLLVNRLLENHSTNFHKIRWRGRTWVTEENIRFWWQSR